MLNLDRSYVDEIIAHAREDNPNECCGIIAGTDGHAAKLYRAVNSEASPYRYNVDPKDLLRIYRDLDDRGWDVLAIYHSHTHTEAYPSPTDVSLAAWPEAYYLIVSLQDEANPVLRAFRIQDGQVSEEELTAV
ncbi:MAG: M67 family metallopeptidase [Chloroflexi bacterium]|nr:M67 family metallopeptidase [Chloroflexota bacterium]